ncbi:energy transducer TonB [Faecalibacter macacae]|uniref:Energy transducer TonB n=1 Tax=Faecalibacter macacae TaxID=1859289 RepID=A0A3L9M6C8_9FLAO|nr:hypothetical protein [Faecalibacter macacae]RLZ08710.1 hypothetical protein EAH69_09305 [Faecalibacter macacae]
MENRKFLDILFENRNKSYGAYELRITENQSLMKALFIGFGIVGLGMGGFVYSNKMDKINYTNHDKTVTIVLDGIPPYEMEKEKIVEPPVEPPTEVKREQLDTKQIKEIMPTPTEAPKEQETIVDRKDLEGADLGAENREGTIASTGQVGGGDVSEGDKNVSGSQNNAEIPKGPETKAPEVVKKAITTKSAKVMAIYPGCEKEAKNGNEALTKCLSDKLSNELSYNMDDYAAIAERENKTNAVAKMQFIINRNGEITQVKSANGSDVSLGKEAKKALEKINKDLQRKGKKIKPAKYQDDTDADLIFSIPVRFQQM